MAGVLTDVPEPASVVNPSRYGSLTPAYLALSSIEGKRNTFYGADGTFDICYPTYDMTERQGTTTLGEFLTQASSLQTASGFKGDISVPTGSEDA